MKKMLVCTASAAAMLAALPAIAQTAQTSQASQAATQAQTAPKAAKVHTRAEIQAKVAGHFARLDSDRDGFVTRAEADSARARLRDRASQRMTERHSRIFDRMDSNKDGSISRVEFGAVHAESRRHGRGGERLRRPAGMRAVHGMAMIGGRMFELADSNSDGRVSLQEAQAAALRHFDMADSNRDGQVTRDERRQMRQRMINERRPG